MPKLRVLLYLGIVASLFIGLTQGAQALTTVETHVSKSSVSNRTFKCEVIESRGDSQWFSIDGDCERSNVTSIVETNSPDYDSKDISSPDLNVIQRARMCQQQYGLQSFPVRNINDEWRCTGGSGRRDDSSAPAPTTVVVKNPPSPTSYHPEDITSPDLSVEQRAVRCRNMYGDQSFPIRRGNGAWECIGGALKPR